MDFFSLTLYRQLCNAQKVFDSLIWNHKCHYHVTNFLHLLIMSGTAYFKKSQCMQITWQNNSTYSIVLTLINYGVTNWKKLSANAAKGHCCCNKDNLNWISKQDLLLLSLLHRKMLLLVELYKKALTFDCIFSCLHFLGFYTFLWWKISTRCILRERKVLAITPNIFFTNCR